MLKIKVNETIETPAILDLQMDEKNNTLLAEMASHVDAEALLTIVNDALFENAGELSEYKDNVVSLFVVYSNVAAFMDDNKSLSALNDFILKHTM